MINNTRPIVRYLREEQETCRSQNRGPGGRAAAAGCVPVLSQPSKAPLVSPVRETDVYATFAASLPAAAWG